MTFILVENLKSALYLAIRKLEDQGMGNCGAAQAYRENLAALERGEHIEVRQ